jgi:hypothetical protein
MGRTLTRRLLPLVGLGLVGLCPVPPTHAATTHASGSPSLVLSPTSGMPGTLITVVGTNFVPSDWVFLHWDVQGSPELGRTTTDGGGYFTLTVGVPGGAAVGTHQVLVVAQGQVRAAAVFAVTNPPPPSPTPAGPPASLSLSPTSGAPGAQVTLLGLNFVPGDTVYAYWDSTGGTVLGQTTADGGGYFGLTVTIPGGASVGGHQILIDEGGQVRAGAVFTVTPPPAACSGFDVPVPLFGDICIDISGLIKTIASTLAGMFSGTLNAITAPFVNVLTQTPDFANDATYAHLNGASGGEYLFNDLRALALVLWLGFFFLAIVRYLLSSIGGDSAHEALGAMRRGVVGLLLVFAAQPLLGLWFVGLNDVATMVNGYMNSIGDTAFFTAVINALAGTVLVPELAVVYVLFAVIAMLIALLIGIVRVMGLLILAVLYALAPAALVTYVSPEFSRFSRWWFESFVNVSLWGVGYAITLKGLAIVIGDLQSWLTAQAGGAGSIGASIMLPLLGLGGLLVLYRVPRIISGAIGGAILSTTGAMAPTDTLVQVAQQMAVTRLTSATAPSPTSNPPAQVPSP